EEVQGKIEPNELRHDTSRFSLPSLTAHTRKGRMRFYGVLAAAATALLSVFVYVRLHQPVVLGGSSALLSPRVSVAVLGFTNLSGDPREAWLSTAFSD